MQAAVDSHADSREDIRRAVLLISEDGNTHPLMKGNLRRQGYRVLLACGVEDAEEWMGGGYVHADLVLLNLVGKTTDEALASGGESASTPSTTARRRSSSWPSGTARTWKAPRLTSQGMIGSSI